MSGVLFAIGRFLDGDDQRGDRVVYVVVVEHLLKPRLDWRNGKVRDHAVFDDRFAAYPGLCWDGARLFLLTTEKVDIISLDLEREATTSVVKGSAGIVCGSSGAWVVGIEAGSLTEVTRQGTIGRTMSWNGKGAADVIYDRTTDTVFGSDQAEGKVFACQLGRDCRTTTHIGKKPTDLSLVDGHFYVVTEGSREVAVIDSTTLELTGTVPFPGIPRAITLIL